MISIAHACLLGLVEGLTEFLPVSSTAHLVLTNQILGATLSASATQTLEIAIQGGAILAVLVTFYKEFFAPDTFKKIVIGTIPTLLIAFVMKDWAEQFLSNVHVIAWALIIGGIILIIVERYLKQHPTQVHSTVSTRSALVMGLSQCLALIPGVSRSGTSIVTGLLLRESREHVVSYSFFLAVPIIGAATAFSLLKHPETLTSPELLLPFSIACVTAFVSALVVIKYFLAFVRKFSFVPFGIYRIIIGICILLFL